jgi:3-hydroxyisobutyrate dehydrogenase
MCDPLVIEQKLSATFKYQNHKETPMTHMKIGLAGTGKMGSAITKRLLGLGHTVTVWNRSPARCQPLLDAGAGHAATPQALVEKADVIITILTDEQALDDVYMGANGFWSGADKANTVGKLFIDMSTVRPAKQQAMGERAKAAGASYLECPVGGSVGPASEGKLMGFVGGDAALAESARPLLDQLCKRVEYVGALGSGATMKLAINLPLMVYWQTLGEALSLIQPLGLDPKRVIDIFTDTSGGPNMLKVRGGMIAEALSGAASSQVTVNVATMRKDVKAMIEQGALSNMNMPVTAVALEKFDAAAKAGLDASDCTQLLVWWLGQGGKQA